MTVLGGHPEIFNHNMETVRELTPTVRHKATYERSLTVLSFAHQNRPLNMLIKSGIMVGLGETPGQVEQTLRDLREIGCDIVTIGHYLSPIAIICASKLLFLQNNLNPTKTMDILWDLNTCIAGLL